MVLVQSLSSRRYATTNTDRLAWGPREQAHDFETVEAAEAFVFDVLAGGSEEQWQSSRQNVQLLNNGAVVPGDKTRLFPDGPSGYGW